jgi:hypothetical protein
MRFVPLGLVGLTSWLNASAAHSVLSAVTHAALPGLWVLAVEGAGHSIRHYAGLTAPKQESMDGIRLSRWLYAPVQTAMLARRRSLWEITDYRDALQRDRERRLARCDLEERYGRMAWRWKAEARRDRVAYRLGALAPEMVTPEPVTSSTPTAPERKASAVKATAAEAPARPVVTVDELEPVARRVATELTGAGERLSRASLKKGLAAAGHPVGSNTKLDALLVKVRPEKLAPAVRKAESVVDAPVEPAPKVAVPVKASAMSAPRNGERERLQAYAVPTTAPKLVDGQKPFPGFTRTR